MKLSDLTNEQIQDISESLPGDFVLVSSHEGIFLTGDPNDNSEFIKVQTLEDLFIEVYNDGWDTSKRSMQNTFQELLGL